MRVVVLCLVFCFATATPFESQGALTSIQQLDSVTQSAESPKPKQAKFEMAKFAFWDAQITDERQAQLEKLRDSEGRIEKVGKFRPATDYSREELASKVTIVIKTFEREECVVMAVQHIRSLYPKMQIIVADDSRSLDRTAQRLADLRDVQYIGLPFDSGAAAGRNLLIDRVNTPFVLFVDDDVMFSEYTRIDNLLADMESSGADMVGACLDDTNQLTSNCGGDWDLFYRDRLTRSMKRFSASESNVQFSTLQVHGNPHRFMEVVTQRDGTQNVTHSPFCKEVDALGTFFLGRTFFLSTLRWDPYFKTGEHLDFFYRAKQAHAYVRFCTNSLAKHVHSTCLLHDAKIERYDRFAQRRYSFTDFFFVKHAPLKRIELPEATAVMSCWCDEQGSFFVEDCAKPWHLRKDCSVTWSDANSYTEAGVGHVLPSNLNEPIPVNDGVSYKLVQTPASSMEKNLITSTTPILTTPTPPSLPTWSTAMPSIARNSNNNNSSSMNNDNNIIHINANMNKVVEDSPTPSTTPSPSISESSSPSVSPTQSPSESSSPSPSPSPKAETTTEPQQQQQQHQQQTQPEQQRQQQPDQQQQQQQQQPDQEQTLYIGDPTVGQEFVPLNHPYSGPFEDASSSATTTEVFTFSAPATSTTTSSATETNNSNVDIRTPPSVLMDS